VFDVASGFLAPGQSRAPRRSLRVLLPPPEKDPMLYNVHYRVSKGLKQQEEEQRAANEEA